MRNSAGAPGSARSLVLAVGSGCEAIVVLIGRGRCRFDWPQATRTKLLGFARHFLTIPDFFVVCGLSQMEPT